MFRRKETESSISFLNSFEERLAHDKAIKARWEEEWKANHAAAVAAVETPPAVYRIWQSNDDGWWRVGKWQVETIPRWYGQFQYLADMWRTVGKLTEADKPDMKVSAHGSHYPYAPTFKTQREAEKWLRELLKPPPDKSSGYDAEGNSIEPTEPAPVRDMRTGKPIAGFRWDV